MSERTTILLVDDHAMLCGSLKTQLEREPDMAVVAAVPNAGEAVVEALRLRPDIVLLDIEMPGQHCFDAARTVKSQLPGTHIVFLSAFHYDRYIEQAIALEASGYLTKAEPPEKLIEGIRNVMAGDVCYSPEIQARLIVDKRGRHRLGAPVPTRSATLTEREMVVLCHIARGLSKKEAAGHMHVTPSAVDRHCTRLMIKLDIHDRVELARFAIREGLVQA